MHSSAAQEGWGQLMPLSPVGALPMQHISRSGSEEWELLPSNE